MSGLLHLKEVPKVGGRAQDKITLALRETIREFCDTDHGRMITLEDECYRLLSWHPASPDHVYAVRVANVDDAGKPFAHPTFADGLCKHALRTLSGRGFVMFSDGPVYDYRYQPSVFEFTEFLYVPNSKFCTTLIAIRSMR